METIGPRSHDRVMGPLTYLTFRRETPRPPARFRFIVYLTPVGLVVLTGLGFAAYDELDTNRALPGWLEAAIAAGSVLPVLLTPRFPVLAWRLAFVMMFVGAIDAPSGNSWPWNTVQILGFLLVHGRLAVVSESLVTVWATSLRSSNLRSDVSTTLAPAAASASATARPIPWLLPVTSAVLPRSGIVPVLRVSPDPIADTIWRSE